jgi:translocation and assembly module TamB
VSEAVIQRRLARRRLLAWLVGMALVLVLLAAVFLAWLLRSESGLQFTLDRALSALPPGALSIESASGSVSGTIRLQGLRYRDANLQLDIAQLETRMQLAGLWASRLDMEFLHLDGVRIERLPGESLPAESEPWPETLPPLQLPLDIALAALRVRDIALHSPQSEPLRFSELRAGALVEQGRIVLRGVQLDGDPGKLRLDGELDTARRYQHSLRGSWQGPPREDGIDVPEMRLNTAGDWDALRLTLEGSAPQQLRIEFDLQQALRAPRWQLSLQSDGFDPGLLSGAGVGPLLDIELRAEGDANGARLQGRLGRESLIVDIAPSELRLSDGRLELAPLALGLRLGEIELAGHLSLSQSPMEFDLQAEWRGIALEDQPASAVTAGTARLSGNLQAFQLELDGVVQRDERSVKLLARAQGDAQELRFETLRAESESGRLDLDGRIGWTPEPGWQLQGRLTGFDPGDFLIEWSGAIDARIESSGRQGDAGWTARLQLDELGGTLRGRALQGSLALDLAPDDSGALQLDLGIGESRVRGAGRIGQRLDLQLALDPLQLADVLPDAGGRIEGRLRVQGPVSLPGVSGSLSGTELRYRDLAIERFEAELDLPADPQASGSASVIARDVLRGTSRLDQIKLSLAGSQREHRIEADATAPDLALHMALQGGLDTALPAQGWRGRLVDLQLQLADVPTLGLQQPAALSLDAQGAVLLEQACVAESETPARLCLAVQSDLETVAQVSLEKVPLALLEPWLVLEGEQDIRLHGSVDGEGQLRVSAAGEQQGQLTLRSARGGVERKGRSNGDLLGYRELRVDARLEADGLQLELHSDLAAGGRIEADIRASGLQSDASLSGRASLRFEALAWIELLAPELAAVKGRSEATLDLAGTLGDPQLRLLALAENFAAEVPALGLSLDQGRIGLRSLDAGRLGIDATLRSGPGSLRLDGELQLDTQAEERLVLRLSGENFEVSNTLEVKARISPELEGRWSGGRLRITGKLGLPWARIDLERFESSTALSPDVRVLDPEQPEDPAFRLPLQADVELTVGDDVQLKGFGLDGKLRGALRISERPGRPTSGRGSLDVTGRFRGYGQDLDIVRGSMSYSASPLDNPALNVRAQRVIGDNTVGIQVRGTALRPQLNLWSNPGLDQAETLSYLVLGRPLRTASGADGESLSAASLALGAGGNLLGKQLGQRLGVDELGVSQSAALGGSAFTVGKYLSPRLYVSYGIALFGTGQVLSFKYIINRSLDVQIDSGVENRASFNYRLER